MKIKIKNANEVCITQAKKIIKLEKQISNFIDYSNSQDIKIKELEQKNKNLQDAIDKYIEGKK